MRNSERARALAIAVAACACLGATTASAGDTKPAKPAAPKPPAAAPAKPPAAAKPPPPAAPPPAAAAPAAPAADDPAKKATALYFKGSDLFKAKKLPQALEAFQQSYALVPSPNSHLFIARCMAALGDARNAYLEFDAVVVEATERAKTEDKYGPTRDAAKLERDELLQKLGMVTITVNHPGPSTTVRLGADDVPRERWDRPIPVMPGTLEAKISSGDQVVSTQSVTLVGGQSATVILDAAAPVAGPKVGPVAGGETPGGKPSGTLRMAALAAGGVGVVGLGMFTVAGLISRSTYSSLREKCGAGPCPSSLAGDVSAGKTQQGIANAGLVIGLIGVAAGTTLIVVDIRKRKSDAAAKTGTGFVVGPGYAGVEGRF